MAETKKQDPRVKVVVSPRFRLPEDSVEVDSADGQVTVGISSDHCVVTVSDLVGAVGRDLSEIRELFVETGNPLSFKVVFRDERTILLEVNVETGTVELLCFGEDSPWEDPVTVSKVLIPQARKETA